MSVAAPVEQQAQPRALCSGALVRRGGRVRYQGRWVSSHWYNRYVATICTGKPVPKVRKKRVPLRDVEKAWLKQQLDAMVERGELTCDSLGRYGLPGWNTPNGPGEPPPATPTRTPSDV